MEDVSKRKREERGITLIALVITIIVLLILAGVTINLTIGERGIFTTAQRAAKNYTNAQNREMASLDAFDEELNGAISILGTGWNETKKVNAPQIADGLTPVIISDDGSITEVSQYDSNWYDYENRKWANAQSDDGSLWVWIPRYAYKIIQPIEEKECGTIEVIFLKGTSDEAVDSGKKIVRAKEVSDKEFDDEGKIDGEETYIVHPAFCDGSGDKYPNGEWDSEIPGFWIAKFEAGFVGEPTGEDAKNSTIRYTTEPTTKENYYGTVEQGITPIKYPIFKACRPSYNLISIGDSFELSKKLTENDNPYGFNSSQIDSHLTKNSEWGAVVYLAWSKYGRNADEMVPNNVKALGNDSVSTVTGYGADVVYRTQVEVELSTLVSGAENKWTDPNGKKASTTGNITGIYDMSGGSAEGVAASLKRTDLDGNIKEESFYTKYINMYDDADTGDDETGSYSNFLTNRKKKFKGDALFETYWEKSTMSAQYHSWNYDSSRFSYKSRFVICRGGDYNAGGVAGIFAYTDGREISAGQGFRCVLINIS